MLSGSKRAFHATAWGVFLDANGPRSPVTNSQLSALGCVCWNDTCWVPNLLKLQDELSESRLRRVCFRELQRNFSPPKLSKEGFRV